jgi:hypothetical protein
MSDPDPIRFDTRIAVMLSTNLAAWQELNVTAFLSSGLAADPDLLGAPYRDADGVEYLALLGQPVMVFTAEPEVLAAARLKAVERGMRLAIYTREMFSTGHDAANRAAVEAVHSQDLDLVGVGIHGPRNAVDRLTKAARLHE